MNEQPEETALAKRVDREVTSALEVGAHVGGIAFENATQVMEVAKLMACSAVAMPKHLRGNPGACLGIVFQAVEWRMSPFAVANKSYSVNDRLAYESQLIQAVIISRAPIKGRFKFTFAGEGQSRTCTASITTLDGEECSYTSAPIGQIKVKNSPLWQSDPDQQLTYLCGRSLCRRYFPDVLMGIYAEDELEASKPKLARARIVPVDPFAGATAADQEAESDESQEVAE